MNLSEFVIFLDIDGVLNTKEEYYTLKGKYYGIDTTISQKEYSIDPDLQKHQEKRELKKK